MKVVIFGSSGFVGKNLTRSLQKDFEIQELSVRENRWETKIDQETEVFINLIGKAHDNKKKASEEDYYFSNIKLAQDIFEVFINSTASLLIYISSVAAIQEFSAEKPLTENDDCFPVSPYGKTKRTAEEWLQSQTVPGYKKVIILRPPMIHGPGDKGNLGLLYKIISTGLPYPLAAFKNERSFIGIENFNFYIAKIIENRHLLHSGIYHISDNEPLSTTAIVKVIKEVLEVKNSEIAVPKFLINGVATIGDFLPLPLNTKRLQKMTSSLVISNHKINQLLRMTKLPFTAEEGLRKTIKSFRK
ncbi:NAD-dependent epimerase/dehydratase family protein [Kaistella polysaccharea]|uniref:NAD-dependent epimerase/dehydratase family protein n=1 Tax=Kaistella polysaccharea TaxID=2878534 RepID=UPI001CF14726|nr:NAD-dependent epimerase/dehydratase family protein [Kaistella polysaccharea]